MNTAAWCNQARIQVTVESLGAASESHTPRNYTFSRASWHDVAQARFSTTLYDKQHITRLKS